MHFVARIFFFQCCYQNSQSLVFSILACLICDCAAAQPMPDMIISTSINNTTTTPAGNVSVSDIPWPQHCFSTSNNTVISPLCVRSAAPIRRV